MRIYLASTSPARLATLRSAGVEPVVMPSNVDEDAAVAEAVAAAGRALTPAETVLLLARLKAEAVAAFGGVALGGDRPAEGSAARGSAAFGGAAFGGPALDGFVLGGDSVFELDGIIYGKPHTASVARERWRLQRGRTGVLHSGHWLIDCRADHPQSHVHGHPHGHAGTVSSARVTFADDISDAEIDAYVATGEPLKVAGAFTIDSLGAPFITAVDGDPHTVVGLSLSTLRSLLKDFGVEWHELWKPQQP